VVYTAVPAWHIRVGALILTMCSCGLLLPFIMVSLIRMFFRNFWFAGDRGEFKGEPLEYCFSVCVPNQLLSLITCGCWVCLGGADHLQNKWIDEHTQVVAQDRSLQNNDIYLFQARPVWWKRILAGVISCFTCGLTAPFFFVPHMKETISQMRFGSKRANFVGDTDDYVSSVCFPNYAISLLTCGCYSCLGFADKRTRTWVDGRMVSPINLGKGPTDSHSSYHSTSSQPLYQEYSQPQVYTPAEVKVV